MIAKVSNKEKVLSIAGMMFIEKGHIDIEIVRKMTGIPGKMIETILSRNGYRASTPTTWVGKKI